MINNTKTITFFYKFNINIKIIFRHNKSITQSCIEKSNNYIRNI